MLGCSTICPNCKHQFACCTPTVTTCCSTRRSMQALSGGGLITTTTTTLAPPQSPCPSPQISPSAPLSFLLPPFSPPLQPTKPPEQKPETELQKLTDTVRALRLSGWYYEGLSYRQADEMLKGCPVGTFLVRNSSDPRFLFSLSVQTEKGPTSVRLFYCNGYFRLDAQPNLQETMPLFPSVIDLVQHYIIQSRLCKDNPLAWVDGQGRWYSAIKLLRPLRSKTAPSLKHLARLAVHRSLEAARPKIALLPSPHLQLELPQSLLAYLGEYPHSV